MYAHTLAWSLLPLALALPLESRDEAAQFVITALGARFPYPGVYGVDAVDSFVNIQVTYPDPASDSGATLSTSCSVNWPKGTDPGPTDWSVCADPSVQFRLPSDGWTRDTNFNAEIWQTLTDSGSGLDGSHIIASNPGNPSDPNALMFCLQMGKFNPLTCTLTGPYGQSPRTVILPAVAKAARPE